MAFLRLLARGFAGALLPIALAGGPAQAQIFASSADDVCAPATDPCVVTETVEVEDGAILDFGLRGLEVAPGGLLDFADGTATVRCGRFLATTLAEAAINLRSEFGDGGKATVQARRACSGALAQPCLEDADCGLLGLGSCSVGDGTITLGGRVTGSAETSAGLVLEASGDIVISERIDVPSSIADSSGGDVTVQSWQGSVDAGADINAKGGGLDSGGTVTLFAATDIAIGGTIDVRGGEFDGGSFEAGAGGNIEFDGDVLADSTGGAGYGGAIVIAAGGEFRAPGGSGANRLLLRANGGGGVDGFGADGGEIDVTAGSVALGAFFRAQASGSSPDGSGGAFALVADTAVIDGEILMTGPGGGAGGDVDIAVGGLDVGATAKIDVDGGEFGGGFVVLAADDDLTMNGAIEASGSSSGSPGRVEGVAGLSLRLGGSIVVDGDSGGAVPGVRLAGCTLVVAAGASIENRSATAVGGRNELAGTGFLTI
jgi:hypothetical protein